MNKVKSTSKYIYTVTCLNDVPSYALSKKEYNKLTEKERNHRNHRRCFGWFGRLQEAKKNVKNNTGDVHECSHLYAVIEKVAEGVYGGCEIPKEWWYKWDDSKYVPIEKPKELNHVINFGMG